jgi:hypothetical protein
MGKRGPKKIKQTKEFVFDYIKKHEDELKGLNIEEIKNQHSDFYCAAYKVFGRVWRAFDECGVCYKQSHRKYSKQELLNMLKEHYSCEEKAFIKFPYSASIRTHFGSIDNALKEINMPAVKEIRNELKKKMVIEDIRKIAKEEEILRTNYVKNKYSSLYYRAYKLFGRWENAVKEAGHEDKLIMIDNDTPFMEFGLEFQRLLGKAYDALGYNLKHNVTHENGATPDFSNENKLWIDAKLNRKGLNACGKRTREYAKLCDELLLVCLIGKDYNNHLGLSNVNIKNVEYLFDQLDANGYGHIKDKFIDLKIKVENFYKTT